MKFRLIGRGSGKDAGRQNEAGVSAQGEVLTRAFDYSDAEFQTINVVDTAFNFFKPKTGFRFVIKGTVISGNRDGVGIVGNGASGNLVEGNFIGTDVTGTIDIGNSLDGVRIVAAGNTIGGTAAGARNVISGNTGRGIFR